MIQVAPQMRILVAIEAVDLRKGIDGLAQLCREKLGADPISNAASRSWKNCMPGWKRSSPNARSAR